MSSDKIGNHSRPLQLGYSHDQGSLPGNYAWPWAAKCNAFTLPSSSDPTALRSLRFAVKLCRTSLVQIMAGRLTGAKPLSEPMIPMGLLQLSDWQMNGTGIPILRRHGCSRWVGARMRLLPILVTFYELVRLIRTPILVLYIVILVKLAAMVLCALPRLLSVWKYGPGNCLFP